MRPFSSLSRAAVSSSVRSRFMTRTLDAPRVLSASSGLACQCLDHRKPTFGLAPHHIDPPFFLIVAHYDVRTQGRKSLRFQLLQDRSKGGHHGSSRVVKNEDLKTCCQQVAAYFIWRGEETNLRRGGPRQRIVGLPRCAGARQGKGQRAAGAKYTKGFAEDTSLV